MSSRRGVEPDQPHHVRAALRAIEAWDRRPTRAAGRAIRRSLREIAADHGARGAFLRIDAPPLRPAAIGCGTLRAEPSGSRHRHARLFGLGSAEGDLALGSLWLDPDPAASTAGAPADAGTGLEGAALDVAVTVEAAWAGAQARAGIAQLRALDAATQGIASVLSTDRVLQLIVDRVRELVGAQYAALGIVDHQGSIDRFITSGISRADRERIGPPPRGHGLLGLIIREARSIRIPDIGLDERRVGFPPHHPEMRAFLGVPVSVKGHPVGNLYLTNKHDGMPFSADDQRLVEMFASHAGIAIENARLHEQVQRLAIVEERERIGRDLHDHIIQSIYAVGLSLEDVPELMDDEPAEARARVERAIDALDQSIRDIRNFIFGLRPELLEQAGLVGGLAALSDEFRVNSMVDIELSTNGIDPSDLAAEQTAQLLAVVREALSNVARHSKATRATIQLEGTDTLRLVIADNGVGFDLGAARGVGHQGLVNIRTRVASIGGDLSIESRSGAGTRIIISLPRRGGDQPA